MNTINISKLANLIQAEKACIKSNNSFADIHADNIDKMLKELPHGSGLDGGVKLEKDLCTNDKLVFSFSFHHLDENGYYDGWTDHSLIIKPSLMFGYEMKITGRDKNMIKDYLHELFSECFEINPNYHTAQTPTT